ncbi:hypothetical protein AAON49_07045 [Pseudotenacibaculum sp. MALMAid0570]|uniref:hypothetical protein n=1 Tax=Pseudotenacibaculum sp. MALMAid0570 TaxID=3143938 RepID=UPI0032DF6FF4
MKVKLLLITVVFSICSLNSQNNKLYYFQKDNLKIETVKSEQAEIEITYQKKRNKDGGIQSFDGGTIINVLAPKLLEELSRLIYNPKKYIFSSSNKYKFIRPDSIGVFSDIKTLKYTRVGSISKEKRDTLMVAHFSTKNISAGDNVFGAVGFTLLKLDSIIYKRSRSKITKRRNSVNLIIEAEIEYFNFLGEKKIMALNPIQINNIKPDISNKYKSVKKNSWAIPNSIFPSTIFIEITEVNSHKKAMDKWRKLYEDNKDKIVEKIIENITN